MSTSDGRVEVGGAIAPRRRYGIALLLLPALLALAGIYALPLAQLLLTSVYARGWTFANYIRIVDDPVLWSVLSRTLLLGVEVALAAALAGYPVAYMILRASERWQKVLLLLVVMPVWTSTLVRAFAWMVLLGRQGLLNHVLLATGVIVAPLQLLYTRAAVIIGLVHVMLPYFIFPALSAMRRVDQRLVQAAASLGAGRRSTFWLVFFPLSLPGVAGGSILVFILSIGFFVTPALLGGLKETTYVMLIEQQVNTALNWPLAAAMSVVLFAATLILVVIFGRLLGFGAAAEERARSGPAGLTRLLLGLAGGAARLRAQLPGRGRRRKVLRRPIGTEIAGGLVILFVLLPILILFPMGFSGSAYLEFPPPSYSLQWYRNYFTRPDWLGPTATSFEVALATMAAATLIGSLAALGLSRARFRGAGACLGFLISPTMMPTLVIAVAIYFEFVRLRLVGTIAGLVAGHLVIATPVVIVTVLSGLRRLDGAPEQAARSLGAGPIRAFMSTSFHMLRPSIVSAAFFAFLASFDDVVIALFVSGTSTATLPKKMWESVRLDIDPTLAAVSCLLILVSVALVLAGELVARRAAKARRGDRGA